MNSEKVLCFLMLATTLSLTGCSSCTRQHDPSGDHAKFKAEEAQANKPEVVLGENGTYPAPAQTTASTEGKAETAADPITEKFNTICAACHGKDGASSGPAAAGMNPRPRNFTDEKWQASVDDARIAQVIKGGGASVGLSPTMAPWGGVLSDAEITEMVKKVRSFAKSGQ
ncbi:MAG: cytochrome c [Oligoflexales bacterium]